MDTSTSKAKHGLEGAFSNGPGMPHLGSQLIWKRLLIHCDNVVVAIMASGTPKDMAIMHLLWDVFFSAAQGQYVVFVQHIFLGWKITLSMLCLATRWGVFVD